MDSGKNIVNVVLGEHYLGYAGEIVRLVFSEPQQLGSGEAGKGDIPCEPGKALPSYIFVEITDLLFSPTVIPENCGADDPILAVENDKTVHLTSAAYAGYLSGVKAPEQLRDAFHHSIPPVLRILLAPAGLGKFQGVFPGNRVFDVPGLIHK